MTNKKLIYLKGFAKGKSYWQMLQAIHVANVLHAGQKRKGGDDYISHPVSVAYELVCLKLDDEDLLAAALLHDVIEDCKVNENDLIYTYGIKPKIASLVGILSKQSGLNQMQTNIYYEDISKNILVTLIKIPDRCHNISTMVDAFSIEKMESYVQETEKYILPLCSKAVRVHPEYSDQIYVMKNHIESVLVCIKAFIKEANKDDK